MQNNSVPTFAVRRGGFLETGERAVASSSYLLGGEYRTIGLLGRGGMGAVYEVEDRAGARFAAKVLAKHLDPIACERFVREARAAGAVNSPHVVKIVEVGYDEEQRAPYIVMDRLRGADLAELIKRHGGIAARPLAQVCIQAARGLAAAHRCGIAHRDMKPANLFLHCENGTDVATVKVCDFGIAKTLGRGDDEASGELTHTGGMVGSPHYVSPEQAVNAKHVDQRTDIWSLGVTLYEGLSGKKLWDGCTSIAEILVAICTKEPPRLDRVAPWIEPALADVVHRALQREPDARYPSMEAMIAALEPFATDQVRMAELAPARIEPRAETTRDNSGEQSSLQTRTLEADAEATRAGRILRSRSVASLKWPVAGLLVVVLAIVAGVTAAARRSTPDVETRSGTPLSVATIGGSEPEVPRASAATALPVVEPAAERTPFVIPGHAQPSENPAPGPRHPSRGTVSSKRDKPAMSREPEASAPGPRVHASPSETCRPPYTIDSSGVRHVKVECME